MKITRARLAWICVAAVAVAVAAAVFLPLRDWTEVLEEALEERNLVTAMLLFAAAYVIASLALVPAWIFPIAAGAAFGFAFGLVASVAASTLGALASFFIARHVLRERIERAARKSETFIALDKAMEQAPFKVVALSRLSPVLPSGLKSYFLGLTCVDPGTYAAASVAGMLPGLAIKVYLGHAGRGLLSGGGPAHWAMLSAGIAATAGIAWTVSRVARRQLGF